ncbi:MAG: hypothetical protein ABH887_01450 [bacterium]
MGSQGKVSNYHQHKDGSKGWDINIKSRNGHGKTSHKMHVTDYNNVGKSGGGLLSGFAKAAGSVFDKMRGGKENW